MDKEMLRKRIEVAAGRRKADTVIKHVNVIDVYSGQIYPGDIAIADGVIAGVVPCKDSKDDTASVETGAAGNNTDYYEGYEEFDGTGLYAAPGLIDGHIHIESAHVSPEEMGRICVPHGTTTIIADPHEIVNVGGLTAMKYMLEAAEKTVMDIRYMIPSCVPATPFENAGAVLSAQAMRKIIDDKRIPGLGEYMNYPGIVNCAEEDLDKLTLAINHDKIIDGHSPSLMGKELNAYAAATVHDDHECTTIEEMQARIRCGMYILLREGTACHDLPVLVKGLTPTLARRCLLCSDDRMANTIFTKGHLEEHLRICVRAGIDPITAIQMASLNAAECFRLYDRGAIAPGLRADLVLFEDLQDFHVKSVFIEGKHVAEAGEYLLPVERCDISNVRGIFNVKDFSPERFKLHLGSDRVHAIEMCPGGILTRKKIVEIKRDADGDFVYDPEVDRTKAAVIERHHGTGNMSVGILEGYGIRFGAIAVSFAHDSHNIIVTGVNDADMYKAVETLIEQRGGIALVRDQEVLYRVPMPIAGIMTDAGAEEITKQLLEVDQIAYEELGISHDVDPVTTLSFMALPVIPEVKLTDMGLFDVTQFKFIDLEA